jgi:hypothetical protein
MVWMPRSARPAAMRGPMCLTDFTGVESWSGIGFDGSSGSCADGELLRVVVGWVEVLQGANSRFPEGMTERKARARATAMARARAGADWVGMVAAEVRWGRVVGGGRAQMK